MNETGFAPPPVSPPAHPKTDHSLKLLIVATLGVIAAFVIFFIIRTSGHQLLPMSSPIENGTRLELATPKGAVWYQVEGGKLAAASGPSGFEALPFTITEIAPALANGDRPVLVDVKGQKGTILGVLRAGDTFAPLLADGTEKEGLVVRPDGLAMYSTPVAPVKPVLAKGTQPPVVIDASVVPPPTWQIELVHLSSTAHAPKSLGEGRLIGMTGDGTALALSASGVIGVNAITGTRHTLISTGGLVLAGAVGAGGSFAIAIVNPLTKLVDVYSTDPLSAAAPYYSYTIADSAGAIALSFPYASATALVALMPDGSASVYSFASDPARKTGTLDSASPQ